MKERHMFTFTIGQTTFDFSIVVGLLALLAVFCIACLIKGIATTMAVGRVSRELTAGHYNYVSEKGEKLIRYYEKNEKALEKRRIRRLTPTTQLTLEHLHSCLAVASFAKRNDEKFLLHLGALTQEGFKDFWLAMYYLKNAEFEKAKEHYDRLPVSEENQRSHLFLDSIFASKQGDIDKARAIMQKIRPELHQHLFAMIADEILATGTMA